MNKASYVVACINALRVAIRSGDSAAIRTAQQNYRDARHACYCDGCNGNH